MILLSATYRQSSLAGKDLQEKDPDNTWLARGPSGRMAGEMIRDNALFASSMLGKRLEAQVSNLINLRDYGL